MASLYLYRSLIPPQNRNQPTNIEKQAAKAAFDAAENGDEQPFPLPFTYGKIYNLRMESVNKLPNAPPMSTKDMLNLIQYLTKKTSKTFLDTLSAILNKKTNGKTIRNIGKRLNSKNINMETRKRNRREQKKYNLLIELSTNVTGKHTIFYSSQLKSTEPNSMGPWQYPTIARNPDEPPPYSFPRDKKNKEWVRISKEIRAHLKSLFHKDNELVFENPIYPGSAQKYFIFKINSYQWEFLPTNLDDLTGKDYFKFYISYNHANPQDPNLYIVMKVRLIGKTLKNRNKIDPIHALPVAEVENNSIQKKTTSFCDSRFENIKDIANNTWSNLGIFTDSSSEKFEKKMTLAKKNISTTRFLKLYNANKSKALAYWEQEYYCRQAINFNAGIDAGWPNININITRFPYDPWTLQPGIWDTHKWVAYPNNVIPFNNLQSTDIIQPDRVNEMRAVYNALEAGPQRPPFPIPFSPFGMTLKPLMVVKLFQRMNVLIDKVDIVIAYLPVIPENVRNAARSLQTIRVNNKLPKLSTIRGDGSIETWNNLFIIYEYLLYHDYLRNIDSDSVLEPYPPYPSLPEPVDDQPFGFWTIGLEGNKQWAIPVNTTNEPWSEDVPPAEAAEGLQNIAAVESRPYVTWQQIKKNKRYVVEAKKWAEWMVLSHPFPIPGFPQYSDYILLRQNYILHKLASNTNFPLPETGAHIGFFKYKDRKSKEHTWRLPNEENRTANYVNPYSIINEWTNDFVNTFVVNDYPPLQGVGNELFIGPPANKYPFPVWPKDNMRVIGNNVFMPLKELPIAFPKRIKDHELGNWRGGRKTLKKRRYNRKKRTLKRKV